MLELMRKIKECDIVSFDIFDTIIMRKTLYPHDIFAIVEKKAKDQGIKVKDFLDNRIKAEQNLIAEIPDIYALYRELQLLTGISDKDRNELLNLELKTEHDNIIRRDKMCEVMRQAHFDGKKVYLISDMYIPRSILTRWLDELGIVTYEDIFISCEYHKPKVDGLFDIFRIAIKGNAYLHIGDNPIYDGKYAGLAGIQSHIIKNSLYLLEETGIIPYKQYLDSLQNRIIIGLVISRLFNDPFCLGDDGDVTVESLVQLVYCAAAPMIVSLVQWIMQTALEKQYATVLLSSRDGFLIDKMFRRLEEHGGKLCFRYIYLYASRVSYSVLGMENREQFDQAMRRPDDLGFIDCVNKRFDLDLTETENLSFFEKNKLILIEKASYLKSKYLEYYKSLQVKEKSVFFDFVSSGTCLSLLSKILGCEMQGLFCFHYSSPMNDCKQMSINSYLNKEQGETFWEYYKIFEVIMTSFEGTFLRMNQKNNPVFDKDIRSKEELNIIAELQNAVMDFWDDFLALSNFSPVSVDMLIKLAELFVNPRISVIGSEKESLFLYDSYEGGKIKIFE